MGQADVVLWALLLSVVNGMNIFPVRPLLQEQGCSCALLSGGVSFSTVRMIFYQVRRDGKSQAAIAIFGD